MAALRGVLVAFLVLCVQRTSAFYYGQFPDNFAWGVSTSAYQTEGSWNEGGRGPSIWDTFSKSPGKIKDGSNGDQASDSYKKYREDVQLLKQLGVKYYRFSISWSRVLSNGTLASRNEEGIQFYKNLVQELKNNNIEPVVTLYHWDLPQKLQDMGGWDSSSIVTYFAQYSELMFKELGPQVKMWITINEPYDVAWYGYGTGSQAPGIKEPGTKPYAVGRNLILAHVRVYKLYKESYAPSQGGKIGIALNSDWKLPKTNSQEDRQAADRAKQFMLGWFASPIFGNGDYPEVMKTRAGSRLPSFSPQEIIDNRGSSDFFGINHYTTKLVENSPSMDAGESYSKDLGVKESFDPTWDGPSEKKIYPEGMRELLKYIKSTYGNPVVYVTENGVGDCGTIVDETRVNYLKNYIDQVLQALKLDHVDVRGYFVWSLIDNFEWSAGYTKKYGIYKVDFERGGRDRTPKASANFYRDVITHNGFPTTWKTFDAANYIRQDLEDRDDFIKGQFPHGFAWGVATSAYQIEGGWNADGKGPSIWDVRSHKGWNYNRQTGDVACDSYHKYKEDVQMLVRLGVSHYRFSIAWSRVMADGTLHTINSKGIEYYNNLINELLANNIQPMVTLYHWDLPQALQDIGGWQNDKIIEYFNDYARLCFSSFGDRVKLWITFNEAFVVAWLGYGIGVFAPGVSSADTGAYEVAHNIIRSHTRAYRTYETSFKTLQQGQVGITLDCDWKEPQTYSTTSRYAAERALQFKLGWFANPIFGNGDYPSVMKRKVADKSRRQGYPKSRLPEFTPEEIQQNRGAFDFLGLNHYTTNLVREEIRDINWHSYESDQDIDTSEDPCWNTTESGWLRVNPWGIRRLLKWIKDRYGNPPVYVTENGVSDKGEMMDYSRARYYTFYINEVLKAVRRDGCDVRGYMAWALMDNMEWTSGYSQKFGLYYVDFNDPKRPRTAKHSASVYSKIVADNGFGYV